MFMSLMILTATRRLFPYQAGLCVLEYEHTETCSVGDSVTGTRLRHRHTL
jgi:hypothetical protein